MPLEGLDEVEDVDAPTLAVDEPLHLRVPTTGLVAKMHASVEELLHGDDCSHVVFLRLREQMVLHAEA